MAEQGLWRFDTRLRRFLRSDGELSPEQLQKLYPNYTSEQIAARNEPLLKRNLSLEEIQKLFPSYTLAEIAQAQEPIIHQNYSEGSVDDGNGYQDDDEHNAPSGYALALASSDPVNAQRSTSSRWSKQAALGYRWPEKHAKRNVIVYEKKPNKRVYGSPWVDYVERQTALQDDALLKLWGCQKFTEYKMARCSTANTGDWDENGNWRATEHRRLEEDGPSSRTTALTKYRYDSPSDLREAARQMKEKENGPTNALGRDVPVTRKRA